ncbi:DnaA regulatory inactivator Hda [Spongiibacter sp. KMU-166]|uniref:DnaA regulatory inactivator Hda n=1 Tax=Spongiibacter thalassae TaxID=2721624 RepID=A0ABX1GCU3_9GAMM|nr:DnaA regulatory inactivator Hda [Spongiibacter thalassae]NKI16308.1 DnaA regulatory inactivator Hda [Spongiibacter thalassae]
MTAEQLPLALSLDTEATFDNYYVPHSQQLLVSELRRAALGDGEQFTLLSGDTGRRHLLQACCHLAVSNEKLARYIPLEEVIHFPAEAVLEGVEALDLLCLDDLGAVAGKADWEVALFNVYNRCLSSGTFLVLAAVQAPQSMDVGLADLRSRLQGFSRYRLVEMTESERIKALQHRALERGLGLNDAVAEYIYRRCQRDFSSLFEVLNELDRHSLVQRRKLTIPFVREVMSWT